MYLVSSFSGTCCFQVLEMKVPKDYKNELLYIYIYIYICIKCTVTLIAQMDRLNVITVLDRSKVIPDCN